MNGKNDLFSVVIALKYSVFLFYGACEHRKNIKMVDANIQETKAGNADFRDINMYTG